FRRGFDRTRYVCRCADVRADERAWDGSGSDVVRGPGGPADGRRSAATSSAGRGGEGEDRSAAHGRKSASGLSSGGEDRLRHRSKRVAAAAWIECIGAALHG